MGGSLRPVDGGFFGLADRGSLGLTSEEEGVNIGILAGRDLVGDEAGEEGDDETGPDIPLLEEACDALVKQ